MLPNLSPLEWTVAVIAILAIAGFIYWARRRQLSVTKLEVTAGPVKAELQPAKKDATSTSTAAQPEPATVNISGNKLFGKNKVEVRRAGTNIADNLLAGENEIQVGAKPGPKPPSTGKKK